MLSIEPKVTNPFPNAPRYHWNGAGSCKHPDGIVVADVLDGGRMIGSVHRQLGAAAWQIMPISAKEWTGDYPTLDAAVEALQAS
jgi:hypothetical protein